MRSLHLLGARISRDLGRLIQNRELNAGDVILHWDAAAAPANRNREDDYAAPTPTTATVGALIHWVSESAVTRGFTEFKAGDAIVTFESDAALGGQGLYFTLPDGADYVQAATGKAVTQFWDVFVGGAALSRTILLRKKS